MMDWRTEAYRAIKAFDDALGRPPFPVEAPEDLVVKAQAVLATLANVVAAGKLKSLDGVDEVTTTLPILCASLREGTPNHTPCLYLYRPLLLAAAHVSSLSTYPISYLLRDAVQVLAPQEAPSPTGSSVKCAVTTTPTETSRKIDDSETEVENEVTLFTFMALTHSLTPMYMRRFLRSQPYEASADGNRATCKEGKGSAKQKVVAPHKGDKEKKAHLLSPPTSASGINGGGEVGGNTLAVPRALLHCMIGAALSDECRAVFESFVDNTPKFLACVAGDGDLARRILDVYAARIVPKLKPSSLLPCLDAPLLDYYVDVVAASQGAGHVTLLSSHEFREVPRRTWDAARFSRLACAAMSRTIGAEDAMASLLVYVYLYLTYCDFSWDKTPTAPPPSSPAAVEMGTAMSVTEAHLITAVCKASNAVLLADSAPSSSAFVSSVCVQLKTGALLVEGSAVPGALEPLQVFGNLLLTRPAAAALWRGGLVRELERETENADGIMATLTASASLLERSVLGVLEGILRDAPRPYQGVCSPSKRQQQESAKCGAAKSKRKQQSASGKGCSSSHINAVSGSPTSRQPGDTAEALPAPIPLSKLLSGCCTCLALTTLGATGAEASGSEGLSPVHSLRNQDGRALDCVVRAYDYLLQHQSQRLNAALWHNFNLFVTCGMWQWAMAASCSDTEGRAMAYLLSMRKLLSAPSTATVLTALTADTGSLLWMSPLLLPSYLSLPPTSNAVAEMLSQVLWDSPCRALWIAILRAAASGESVGAGAKATGPSPKTSPLMQELHPTSDTFLFGVLCSQWSHAVLADVAECVATATVGGGDCAALMTSLIRMRTSGACACEAVLPRTCVLTLECVPASLSQHGLQRLLDEVGRLQAQYLAREKSARQEEEAEGRRRILEQLQSIQALAEAHRAFCEAAGAKCAARADEHQQVQEELQRRRDARVARLRADAAALEHKRQVALETLRRKAVQARADADAARQRRFASCQRRLASEYRVSTFLEHLQLPLARVMEVRDALRTVADRITPDDLLEYLVSGKAKVPSDMLGEDDALDANDEADAKDAAANEGNASIYERQAEHQAAGTSSPRPRATGERRDFWADVMDGVSTTARTPPLDNQEGIYRQTTEMSPALAMTTADIMGAYSLHTQSFHARIAPLMDLFCYEGGDEFGHVPDALPILHLRVASRVWPASQVQLLGFADVREAFERMRDRGLVRIHDDVAQLTLLGFRYHYPFHNPEGMLAVHLRESQARVRMLVESRNELLRADNGSEEDNEDDSDIAAENGEKDDEDEASAHDREDRVLPEVEFGI
ncbi:hypothetical protein NXY56_005116 [Leishmania guyanensis]